MAFLDDRVWCHPKWAALSPGAAWLGIRAICYAHGFRTRGELTSTALRMIGATDPEIAELVTVGLWERNGRRNEFVIHDWDVYNDDERLERKRESARDRQRRHRKRNADVTPPVTPRNADVTSPSRRDSERDLARARGESESESEVTPYPAASGGDFVTCENCGELTAPRAACRHCGASPREAGTNPRALTDREKRRRHEALLAAAYEAFATFDRPTSTVILHDLLDDLEREHQGRLSDQERGNLIDDVLARSKR